MCYQDIHIHSFAAFLSFNAHCLRFGVAWFTPELAICAKPVIRDDDSKLCKPSGICVVVEMVHLNGGLHFGGKCDRVCGEWSWWHVLRLRYDVQRVHEVRVVVSVERKACRCFLLLVFEVNAPVSSVVYVPLIFIFCC